MIHAPLPPHDLQHILEHTEPLWRSLADERLFITGGTGFFGIWLLEARHYAEQKLNIALPVTVLSRAPQQFLARHPHFVAHPNIEWLSGDVRDFSFPRGAYSSVIHAATETYVRTPPTPPLDAFTSIVQGTQRVLEFARHCQAQRVLLTSSGAIYGTQPTTVSHIPEDHLSAPDCTNPDAGYAEGKRTAEILAALHYQQYGLAVKIARCFAFVGPHLPLDKHFAIGNFINDVLHERDIHIQGDGTPLRSYLHAADLVIWLLTILLKAQPLRPYNVGSDEALSIADLAYHVANSLPERQPQVHIAGIPRPGQAPARYVPDISRAGDELGLEVRIPLDEALRRSVSWYQTAKVS